jgi:hypothetical protein
MAAIVEVGGGHALHAGQCDGGAQQAGALHADADHAEAHTIAGGHGLSEAQQDCAGGAAQAAAAQERTA